MFKRNGGHPFFHRAASSACRTVSHASSPSAPAIGPMDALKVHLSGLPFAIPGGAIARALHAGGVSGAVNVICFHRSGYRSTALVEFATAEQAAAFLAFRQWLPTDPSWPEWPAQWVSLGAAANPGRLSNFTRLWFLAGGRAGGVKGPVWAVATPPDTGLKRAAAAAAGCCASAPGAHPAAGVPAAGAEGGGSSAIGGAGDADDLEVDGRGVAEEPLAEGVGGRRTPRSQARAADAARPGAFFAISANPVL